MKTLIPIFLTFLLISCASVNSSINPNPIRELKVIAYLDGRTIEDAHSQMDGANDELAQFGIKLMLIEWRNIKFPFGWTDVKILNKIESWTKERTDFDLGIAFTKNHPLEFVAGLLFGYTKPEGATDTFWGRYIVVYSSSPTILFHEVCHCFLYDDMPFGLSFFGIPLTGGTLSGDQQVKLMANKWRDFNVSPVWLASEKLPLYDWKCIDFPNLKENEGKDCERERLRWKERDKK